MADNSGSAAADVPGPGNPAAGSAPAGASDAVLCGVDGPVAVVTINRPAARNAVNGAVAAGMAATLDDLEARPDVRVIVLTGAGGTFCAGMDLKGFLAGENPKRGRAGVRGASSSGRRPSRSSPRSRATRWPAGSRWRSAATSSWPARRAAFGLPEVTRGLVAAAGGLLRLPRRDPLPPGHGGRADRRPHPGPATAPRRTDQPAGAAGQALAVATDLARRLSQNAPLALAATKRVIVESADWPGGRAVRPAERDHHPGVQLSGRHGGRGRVRRKAAPGLAWPVRPAETTGASRPPAPTGGLPGLAHAARVRPLGSGRRGPAHTSGSPPDSLVGDIDVRNRRLPGTGPGGRPGSGLGAYRHRADHPPGTG